MVAQKGQTLGIEFVDAASAVAPVAHQARFLEDAQVLRDRWTRNGQPGGQFVDSARRGAEHLEDGQAGGVAKSGEAVLYVSVHLR